MFAIVFALLGALVDALRPRASLVMENLVLRQQLGVLKRARRRPPLRPIDRAFWVVVSRVWSRWADALAIVKPATVSGGTAAASLAFGPGSRGASDDRRSRRKSWR